MRELLHNSSDCHSKWVFNTVICVFNIVRINWNDQVLRNLPNIISTTGVQIKFNRYRIYRWIVADRLCDRYGNVHRLIFNIAEIFNWYIILKPISKIIKKNLRKMMEVFKTSSPWDTNLSDWMILFLEATSWLHSQL